VASRALVDHLPSKTLSSKLNAKSKIIGLPISVVSRRYSGNRPCWEGRLGSHPLTNAGLREASEEWPCINSTSLQTQEVAPPNQEHPAPHPNQGIDDMDLGVNRRQVSTASCACAGEMTAKCREYISSSSPRS
jgi:hypothetical protein